MKDDQNLIFPPTHLTHAEAHPNLEAYEAYMRLAANRAEQIDDEDPALVQSCLVRRLELAWAAAKAAFGDAATPADAWRIHEYTERELENLTGESRSRRP